MKADPVAASSARDSEMACPLQTERLASLREGLAAPSQWPASRLWRAGSLRLIKGGRREQGDVLVELLNTLQERNRERISAARRFQDAEVLSQSLWPEAQRLLAQQARDRRGLPERPIQAQGLDQLSASMSALMSAYQLALADAYAAHHKTAEQALLPGCALRILEWTWRELELCQQRYQALSGAAWQRANRVFFALLASATADDPLPACAAPEYLLDADGRITRKRLYLSLQTLGLFDALSWPRATQGFIARYCALVPEGVRLEPGRISGNDGETYRRFIQADLAGPPAQEVELLRADRPDHDVLTLDFSTLAQAIRHDQQVFFQREPGGTRAPERLRRLPPAARRPGIRRLARDMDNGAPGNQAEAPCVPAQTLYLSAGMTTIRALLHQVFSRFPHSQSPSSSLPRARRDPRRQPRHLGTSGDPWQLVQHSARLWRICNPGTQSSTALSVGSLVAFGSGEAGLTRPRLGRVARILRAAEVLQVDVQELACFAAPVSLKAVESLSAQSSVRAFLVYDEDFGWGVMTPPQPPLHEGDAIVIHTRRLDVASRLRSIRDATQDFLLFQINPHDPHLGVPSYPRAHKARRRAGLQRAHPLLARAPEPSCDSQTG